MENYDYQQAATELIAMLNTLSLNNWAQKIADSILRSSTSSETLITLRNTLIDLKENQILTPEITKQTTTLIYELTKMIDLK